MALSNWVITIISGDLNTYISPTDIMLYYNVNVNENQCAFISARNFFLVNVGVLSMILLLA